MAQFEHDIYFIGAELSRFCIFNAKYADRQTAQSVNDCDAGIKSYERCSGDIGIVFETFIQQCVFNDKHVGRQQGPTAKGDLSRSFFYRKALAGFVPFAIFVQNRNFGLDESYRNPVILVK